MTYRFLEEADGIYRLRVPFENIYTSVFLVESGEGALLVDCATTAEDVDGVILPALRERGLDASALRALVLTHHHRDHAGGRARLLTHCPTLKTIDFSHREEIAGISFSPLPGHTKNSMGVFVSRCGILISGDGLQGDGVDRYRTSLEDREAYLDTLDRLEADESIQGILFSHAYEPWCEDSAFGREAVLRCLLACRKSIG